MKRAMLLCLLLLFAVNWASAAEEASPPFRIKNVHHILLTVKDLEASLHFYQDILGLTLEQRYKTFAMLNAGTFGVYLSTKPWSFDKRAEEKGAGIFPHFEIDNMDALVTTLKKNNIPLLQEPKSYSWGKECFALDPDGYQWSFVELASKG
jgi:catechol 2,3-dioxygenase-like lactoylglutathione lyase family enzyme